MKILYISNSRIPTEKAYGVQIFKMCEAFSKLGREVELILPDRKNKSFQDINPFDYYQVEKNFRIKKIKSFDPYFLIKLPQGVYIKFQALFFIISLFFYLLFKKNKQEYLFYTRDEYLLPVLQKFSNPSMVQLRSPQALLGTGRVIWEAHSLAKNKNHYLKYWQKCREIISISQGLKNELVKLGIDENKILVARDGVDLKKSEIRDQRSEIRKKLNLPLDKKIIMYTGNFYDWKGVQTLADASQFLSSDEIVVFVGGSQYEINKFKQRNYSILKDIEPGFKTQLNVLGQKPFNQILLYLKSADVLVLPNSGLEQKSKFWTSPLKMFEYMASGVPIIASDLPSIREVLNENNAVLVKSDNSQALAKGIKKILQDEQLAYKISKQALEDVQEYSWDKRAEKIISFVKI